LTGPGAQRPQTGRARHTIRAPVDANRVAPDADLQLCGGVRDRGDRDRHLPATESGASLSRSRSDGVLRSSPTRGARGGWGTVRSKTEGVVCGLCALRSKRANAPRSASCHLRGMSARFVANPRARCAAPRSGRGGNRRAGAHSKCPIRPRRSALARGAAGPTPGPRRSTYPRREAAHCR
jgi:hypothetical protein